MHRLDQVSTGNDNGTNHWTDIAAQSWTGDAQAPKNAAAKSSSGSEFMDRVLSMVPLDYKSFVLPIGPNGEKPKDVPLKEIDKPDPKLPDAWNHPESSTLDGKCGITGVCNMLRLYGIEKEPKDIDKSEYRSVGPGLRVRQFRDDLNELSPDKKFTRGTIDNDADALKTLKGFIDDGKPVAIQYMTGRTNAHWVVVTGITEGKDGPELQLQSWGKYYQVPFKDIQDQWKRGWGGDYPYVVGNEPSPFLKKK
jgi:hypothetical protein